MNCSEEPKLFVIRNHELLVTIDERGDGETQIPRLRDAERFDLFGFETYDGIYLGRKYSGVLIEESRDDFTVPDPWRFVSLRSLLPRFTKHDASLSAHVSQIVAWRANHRHCGRCGEATYDSESENARCCESCGHTIYPRISPAIIVGVLRDDRLLLARNRRHDSMYSILAGFVEPGESLEDTVTREIGEEVSLEVTNIRYFGSQPWPFPDSLMVGFLADHHSGEISVDGEEIMEAGWYRRGELPRIPPHGSISRRIIDWFSPG